MAFIDTQLYIHQMISVKNFILAADVMKSISLLRYQEESKTLSLVSRVGSVWGRQCLSGRRAGAAPGLPHRWLTPLSCSRTPSPWKCTAWTSWWTVPSWDSWVRSREALWGGGAVLGLPVGGSPDWCVAWAGGQQLYPTVQGGRPGAGCRARLGAGGAQHRVGAAQLLAPSQSGATPVATPGQPQQVMGGWSHQPHSPDPPPRSRASVETAEAPVQSSSTGLPDSRSPENETGGGGCEVFS